MPKATVSSGASNAWAEAEAVSVTEALPAPAEVPEVAAPPKPVQPVSAVPKRAVKAAADVDV